MVVASAVLELADALDQELNRTGGTELLRDVELPLVDVLARMERSGIAVDVPALEALESDFDTQVRQAQQDAGTRSATTRSTSAARNSCRRSSSAG